MGSGGSEGSSLIDFLKKRGGGNPLKCIQCGSCTSACIINSIEADFNPRRIVGSIARFNRLPNQNLWLCSTCSLCVDRCPQGVNPLSIIMVSRRILYEDENKIPGRILEIVESVRNTGLAFPLSDDARDRRRLLGLPEAKIKEEGLNEVRRILSEAGF